MGQKTRGGMWCERCRRHILAVKNTHPARNTAAVLTVPLTGGLSLAGVGVGEWSCPSCGGPARRATARDVDAPVPPAAVGLVPEPERPVDPAPSSSVFRRDAERDAEAAHVIRAQVEDAGGETTRELSYVLFRFGVSKRSRATCEYIEECLAEAGVDVSPSIAGDAGPGSGFTFSIAPEGTRRAAADGDLAGDLERLGSLFRDGLLTEAEFEAAKARLLGP